MLRRKSRIEQRKFGLYRGAQPVRRIRPRIQRASMPGWFPTRKGTLEILRVESQIELNGLELFEADPDIVMMAAQPHRLVYWHPCADGEVIRRNYHPDLALLREDGSVVVVDFKPARIAASPAWRRKEALYAAAYALDHGATFLTVTDAMIAIEPRRSNVVRLMLHRLPQPDDEATIAVVAFMEDHGVPTTIGAVRRGCRLPADRPEIDRAYTALMNLHLEGVVSLEMGRPFSDATVVGWRRPTAARAPGSPRTGGTA